MALLVDQLADVTITTCWALPTLANCSTSNGGACAVEGLADGEGLTDREALADGEGVLVGDGLRWAEVLSWAEALRWAEVLLVSDAVPAPAGCGSDAADVPLEPAAEGTGGPESALATGARAVVCRPPLHATSVPVQAIAAISL